MLTAAIVVASGLVAGQAASDIPPAPRIVTIVGAEEPERFPEWYRWEAALSALSRQRPPTEALEVEDEVRDYLLQEADALVERWNVFVVEAEAAAVPLREQGLSEDELYRALYRFEMEYRYAVLAARERIRFRLPPETVGAFEAGWMAEAIAASTVTLTGPAVELFFEPY